MDDVELIKERVNIVDLIAEYLPLKKAGVNFRANCPFHQEKSPSFMVSPERGIFHCFGCGVGGDQFKFLMEKEGIDFKEALEILAQKAGITLKKKRSEFDPKEKLYEANLKSSQYYQYLLLEHPLGKKALEYLKKRGLTLETIKEFGLGYAPNSWESLTKFLKKRSFSNQEIIDSGLGVASGRGCYDRFRGRIIFPLMDIRARVLGFSGRILGEGEPKYINSPQTLIFDKSKFLLGIQLTKGPIKEKKKAIIVEGEMDMLMSYQIGVKNVVASKGTSLTSEQIELLKKYTEEVILCFDTDLAGDAASRRGIELLDQAGLNIKVISLEEVKDPAEACLKDPKIWEDAVLNSTPIYDYYLQSAVKRYDLKSASSKKAIFAELLPIWKKISDPITKEHYIEKLAALLQIKDEFIRKELSLYQESIKKPLSQNGVKKEKEAISKDSVQHLESKDRHKLLEEYLISLLLHIPSEHTFVPNFPETLFTQEHLKQIYVMLVIFLDGISFKGKSFKISEFIKTVPDQLVPILDKLYLTPIDEKLTEPAHWQKEVDAVLGELKRLLIKVSLEKLSLQIKSAQEFEKTEILEGLNRRFRDLSVRLKNL